MSVSHEAPADAPKVLLLIANDVTVDTRVLKYAASLAGFGLRVTILGITSERETTESEVAGARVVRVSVPLSIATYRQRRGLRGALRRMRPGYATRDDAHAARLMQSHLETEFRARRGRGVLDDLADGSAGRPHHVRRVRWALRWRYLRARRFAIRVREGLLNRRNRRITNRRPSLQRVSSRFYLRLPFLAPWRRVVPEIVDYDAVLGPYVDEMQPDVVHPHDVYLIGVAADAVARAALPGRSMKMVYDAREYVPGLAIPPGRVVAAYRNLEKEYIHRADRVITVSEPIARELLRADRLPRLPDLVLNAPVADADVRLDGPDVRTACGLADDVPLLVYSGGLAAPRGVHTVVEALPMLEGVHLAAVSRQRSSYTVRLEKLAQELGVADRFHLVPFVEPDQVMHYLSSATVGVIPLLHAVNHDWALTNKFFEYMHAGLPIITSDVEVQTRLVDELGIGAAFVAGDPDDLVQVVRKVLANLDTYRARLEDPELLHRFSWQAQGEVLHGIYTDLLGPLPDATGEFDRVEVTSLAENDPEADTAVAQGRTVLAIGPTNSAGQAWQWAKALEARYPQVGTEVFWVERPTPFVYPADRVIPGESWRSVEWQMQQQRYVRRHYSHVLMESGRGILGLLNGGFFLQDTPELRRDGIAYAVLFHGSEVRSPRMHRELEPTSPFHDQSWDLGQKLQVEADRIARDLEQFDGPRFVSTPDQLDYVEDAQWLPVVVDMDVWAPGPPVLERERPVVVHVPSAPRLKGSALFDPIGQRLHDRGLIEYRRLENVPTTEMPDLVRDADILFDQFTLALYGVQASQAMSANRLVLSYVGDRVRSRVPAELPIVEVTPQTVEDVIMSFLQDRDAGREQAAKGREYVRQVHDGRRSADVLARFVGATLPAGAA